MLSNLGHIIDKKTRATGKPVTCGRVIPILGATRRLTHDSSTRMTLLTSQ